MIIVLVTQTVAPNSIPLFLHAVLELNQHSLTLPCSVVVLLYYWKSEHDENRNLVMGQWDGPLLLYGWKDMNVKIVIKIILPNDSTWQENLRCTPVSCHFPSVGPKLLCALAHLGCTKAVTS